MVKRNLNDEKTFGLFDRIEVDGVALSASDFIAVSGSLDATLKSSYLETLASGAHDVKIFFKDGVAETKLTIKESADGGDDGSDGANGGSNGGSPQTGDSSQMRLYLVLIVASLLVLAAASLALSVKLARNGRGRM